MSKEDILLKAKILTMLFVLIVFVGAAAGNAFAATHGTPIPPGWTPTPVPHNGGGGGGGGGSYTPPAVVYPKYADVKNSNGQIIGNITQTSSSDIGFWVKVPVTVDGITYNVRIDGKLNSLPSDARLNILGETPDGSTLPTGLSVNAVLEQFNLTGFSSGWDIKAGTLKLTLEVPSSALGSADLSKCLFIRYDGTSYELLFPTQSSDNGNVVFVVTSPHESFGYNSYSKFMLVTASVMPSATPTPTAEAPTPTAETPSGPGLVTVLLAVMLAAVVAAAFVLYFMMQRKQ